MRALRSLESYWIAPVARRLPRIRRSPGSGATLLSAYPWSACPWRARSDRGSEPRDVRSFPANPRRRRPPRRADCGEPSGRPVLPKLLSECDVLRADPGDHRVHLLQPVFERADLRRELLLLAIRLALGRRKCGRSRLVSSSMRREETQIGRARTECFSRRIPRQSGYQKPLTTTHSGHRERYWQTSILGWYPKSAPMFSIHERPLRQSVSRSQSPSPAAQGPQSRQ